MSSDISAPDRRIVYTLLGIAGAALIGWIVAVIVGATVTQDLGTLLAATVGACIGGATTWLSRRGTPATDAPATVAPTVKPVESPLSSNEVAPAVPVPSEAADWVPPAKINPAPEPATDATLSMPVIA